MQPERRDDEDRTPQQLDETQIEDLITEHLVDNLAILPEVDLANALHDFVDKVPAITFSHTIYVTLRYAIVDNFSCT